MNSREIERDAEELLCSSGLDPNGDVFMTHLARRLGIKIVRSSRAPFPGNAVLARVGRVWRIYLRTQISAESARFAVAHEIGEWWLRQRGNRERDAEDVADCFGAALVAPRRRVVCIIRGGATIAHLAAEIRAAESLAALRVGEVTGEPTALVSQRVRVRGDEWTWPPESDLRRAVRGDAPRGLVKVPLAERGRVLLKREVG